MLVCSQFRHFFENFLPVAWCKDKKRAVFRGKGRKKPFPEVLTLFRIKFEHTKSVYVFVFIITHKMNCCNKKFTRDFFENRA